MKRLRIAAKSAAMVGLWRRRQTPEPAEIEAEATRPCPHCGQPVSRGATVCIHCEREIVSLMSYSDFAVRFGSPHSGGPPHTRQVDAPDMEEPGD